ncbi:helix-turn-helix domain-containing protein [Streptomyces sp. SID5785]|uniref:helix-turn-helix domain-containing protein n=1 Tax=Streptomyces sp. SID5785 TaxID=2690309 RepID=UPI0013610E2F|nr:helix-turn-helix transcriptional regulator [Streptomyces sp. SID5785]MZD04265.1 helix-turn-helix domain-containing protein [Streptomyces sp. SID5785]
MAAIPTMRRRMLGAELRKLRDRRGLTGDEAAEQMKWHPSKISRIEAGRSGLRPHEVGALLKLYAVEDTETRDGLEALAREGKRRVWWQPYNDVLTPRYLDYISFEAEASSARSFETVLVPGLLQTPDYARSIIRALKPERTPDEVNALVDVRVARQNAALNREDPLQLWAILDESVLRREVGGRDTTNRQLKRLLDASEQPNVTLQILPFGAGAHAGMLGPFVILGFPVHADLDVVYSEGLASSVYLERDDDRIAYGRTFDRLRAAALDIDPSRDMIARLVREQT